MIGASHILSCRRAAPPLAALALASGLGCLDAGPIDRAPEAVLDVGLTWIPPRAAEKRAEPDSLEIRLYDVTDDPYVASPGPDLEVVRRSWIPAYTDDETGAHFLAAIRIDVSSVKDFRVSARLSFDGTTGRSILEGESTTSLGPGDRKSLAMVLTGPGVPSPGAYALALGKSSAAPGARRHEIPVVVENGDPIGGLQFQIRFDAAAIDSVIGIAVDPSSRLYLGGNGDSLVGTSAARATDSTFRVLAVDLRPVTGEGDTLYEPVRSIPPGNDPLFSLVVGLADAFPSLPDTIRLSLEEVFFSTPSGSTDIAVADTANAILVVRGTP